MIKGTVFQIPVLKNRVTLLVGILHGEGGGCSFLLKQLPVDLRARARPPWGPGLLAGFVLVGERGQGTGRREGGLGGGQGGGRGVRGCVGANRKQGWVLFSN